MSEALKSYKYELKPNEEQKVLLNKHFGSVRWVYNHFLDARKKQYLETKKSDTYYKQALKLTVLKKEEETIWLKEVNSQTLQTSLKNLEVAYLNFFRGNAQYPKFKSKYKRNSFTIPQHIKLEDKQIFFPKFKQGIKVNQHRELNGEIRHCTVSKTPNGKYYISVLVKTTHIPYVKTGKMIGIDLGIKDFAITSDGRKFKNHRWSKKYERDLKQSQQHLSRKTKGSQQYKNQRLKTAKVHEKISNCRKDNLHKVSTKIIKSYDLICLESLAVKNMVKNHKLAKHIQDASWGTFVSMLEYKAEWNEKTIVKVDRFFPSSKLCSNCGWIKQDLTLKDRSWTCEVCNCDHDRDVNASKNILKEGISILESAGTVDYTGGDEVRTTCSQLSVKPEAHPISSAVGG